MACLLCGERCTCTAPSGSAYAETAVLSRDDAQFEPEPFSLKPRELAARRIAVVGASVKPRQAAGPAGDDWRDQVASRLNAHRARRSRSSEAVESLPLGFEDVEPNGPVTSSGAYVEQLAVIPDVPPIACAVVATEEPPAEHVASDSLADSAPPAPYRRIVVAPAVQDNLIEFPLPVEPVDELAEPVLDLPRILEAPEPEPEAPAVAPALLADMCLEPASPAHAEPYEQTSIELPLQVARLSRRAVSGVIDTVLVLAGSAIFAVIVMSMVQFMPHGKPQYALAALMLAVFLAVYQWLFLSHGNATPGMLVAQLELSTFEGCAPTRRMRRIRALCVLLCYTSLGLGFLWALMDDDGLGWHDKISRTYLRRG